MIDKFLNFFVDNTDRFAGRVINRGFWALATFPMLKVNQKHYSMDAFMQEIPFALSYSVGGSVLAGGLNKIYKGIVPDKPKTLVQKTQDFIKSNPRDVILAYGIAGLWGAHLMNLEKKDNKPQEGAV